MTREADVVRALVEMADTLVDDYVIVDLLTGLADRCVNLLGVSAAGVMLASPAGSLRLRDVTLGALNLLSVTRAPVDEADVIVARAFADLATLSIVQHRATAEAQ